MRTKNIAMILTMALTAGLCQTAAPSQAATPKLSAKKLTMKVGKTAALKVKKTSKKAKWSIVSGKKNIRLTAKKKTSVKVKAVKAGKAKISCKIGKKKLVKMLKLLNLMVVLVSKLLRLQMVLMPM
mgnify:CR=1 FL=1